MCYLEPNCVSINFGPSHGGKHKCELNSATDEDHLDFLEEKTAFTFLAIEVNFFTDPLIHGLANFYRLSYAEEQLQPYQKCYSGIADFKVIIFIQCEPCKHFNHLIFTYQLTTNQQQRQLSVQKEQRTVQRPTFTSPLFANNQRSFIAYPSNSLLTFVQLVIKETLMSGYH